MIKKFAQIVVALSCIAASLFCIVMHIWTILTAFSASGWLAALLTLIFPVISELYWFFRVGFSAGFGDPYCLSLIACFILFCFASVVAIVYTGMKE